MTAMTLDHLSKGRVMFGFGVSGPQVVEGWYGQACDSTTPVSSKRRLRSYLSMLELDDGALGRDDDGSGRRRPVGFVRPRAHKLRRLAELA